MSLPDLSVFGFRVGEKYEDIFFHQRFREMIKRHGISSYQFNTVPKNLLDKLKNAPDFLTKEEWKSFPYPFLDIDKQVLIKLSQGEVSFNKKEMAALDALCGDFFGLDGEPRTPADNSWIKNSKRQSVSQFTHGG